ncbi:MAG: fused DSP-PTPase phosphatase/NAD kinase-like protein [Candidatus Kapaibacterium sp.]
MKSLEEVTTIAGFINWLNNSKNEQSTEIIKCPFDKSYWVMPEMLLAGYYPGSMSNERAIEKLNALIDSGIRCIINLMEPGEFSTDKAPVVDYSDTLKEVASKQQVDVKFFNFPIADLSIPGVELMKKILDTIDQNLNGNSKCPVYIHCRGGIGRTGTVVGCWLQRHGYGQDQQSVLDIIKFLRKEQIPSEYLFDSPESEEQRKFVINWSE